ncbi:hypothetical protein FQZ97_888820 [compost metagenome]
MHVIQANTSFLGIVAQQQETGGGGAGQQCQAHRAAKHRQQACRCGAQPGLGRSHGRSGRRLALTRLGQLDRHLGLYGCAARGGRLTRGQNGCRLGLALIGKRCLQHRFRLRDTPGPISQGCLDGHTGARSVERQCRDTGTRHDRHHYPDVVAYQADGTGQASDQTGVLLHAAKEVTKAVLDVDQRIPHADGHVSRGLAVDLDSAEQAGIDVIEGQLALCTQLADLLRAFAGRTGDRIDDGRHRVLN